MIKAIITRFAIEPTVKLNILRNKYTFTGLKKETFLRRTCFSFKHKLESGYSRKDYLNARCFHLTKTNSVPPFITSNIFYMTLGAGHAGSALWTTFFIRKDSQMKKVLTGTACVFIFGICCTILEMIGFTPFTIEDEVPISKRRRFSLYKLNDEGNASHTKNELKKINNVYKDSSFPDNTPETKRVKRVLLSLLKANPEINDAKEFDRWNVRLVKDDQCCNAWMLNDGSIFAFSGLLKDKTDDQLAAFLGVEIAEVLMKHRDEEESVKMKYRLAELVTVPAIWSLYMIPVPLKIGIHLASIATFEGIMSIRKNYRIYEAYKAGVQFAQNAKYKASYDTVRHKPRELYTVQK